MRIYKSFQYGCIYTTFLSHLTTVLSAALKNCRLIEDGDGGTPDKGGAAVSVPQTFAGGEAGPGRLYTCRFSFK